MLPTLCMWLPTRIHPTCTPLEKWFLEKLCQRPNCHCNHSQHCHATSRHNATTINRYEKQLNYSEWSKRHIHFSFLFSFFYRLIATMLSMAALFIDYLNTTIVHKSCLQHRFIIVTIILWWRASGGAVLPIWTKGSHSNHSHILIASVTANLYLI